jgi:hypothetical protein
MSDACLQSTDRTAKASIVLKRGSLHIDRAVCERYFAGLNAVILLRRANDLLVLPVRHAAAGGYLLKVRNAAGDRIVDAADFFREHDAYALDERRLAVAWSAESAGLQASSAFPCAS